MTVSQLSSRGRNSLLFSAILLQPKAILPLGTVWNTRKMCFWRMTGLVFSLKCYRSQLLLQVIYFHKQTRSIFKKIKTMVMIYWKCFCCRQANSVLSQHYLLGSCCPICSVENTQNELSYSSKFSHGTGVKGWTCHSMIRTPKAAACKLHLFKTTLTVRGKLHLRLCNWLV